MKSAENVNLNIDILHKNILPQLDGNFSFISSSTDSNDSSTLSPVPSPDIIEHDCDGNLLPEYVQDEIYTLSFPPCIAVVNARSLYNKKTSLRTLIAELNIDICMVSETWERNSPNISDLLDLKDYHIATHKRNTGQPGGGVCLIINPMYIVENPGIYPPVGVEVVWRIVKIQQKNKLCVVAAAAIYVPPRSKYIEETIEFIVMSIHFLKSRYDNVKFLIGGDINNLDTSPILDSNDSLKQIVETPTHGNRIIDVLFTCMKPAYYPAFVKQPLECDDGSPGEPSDHKIVVAVPRYQDPMNILHEKKTIKFRPLPDSGIQTFGRFITMHDWSEVLNVADIDAKVDAFHKTIRDKYEEIFHEKTIKISQLDKPWMTPQLKSINRSMKREYWKNRKSDKWKNLKKKFYNLRKIEVKSYYTRILDEAKQTNPSKWYTIVKKLGLKIDNNHDKIEFEAISNLSDVDAANAVASHFASISQEYEPLDRGKLPAYLPAQRPPQLLPHQVYTELKNLKKTKSTLPIDIPYKLRNEFAAELATPLTNILNSCLLTGIYPKKWKFEWVTPVPKVKNPECMKELRKISCTSDYSKLFEKFLMRWINSDICQSIDTAQYGNMKGTGTEHLLVSLIDKILSHLDRNQNSPLCIATMLDWSAAFDRQCPMIGVEKFLKCGVRPEIVSVLTSYLSNRSMSVKFNGVTSDTFEMPGGGPQGTLLGVLEYLVQSNDNADCVQSDLRFKYVDDLTLLELISLSASDCSLSKYNAKFQVPSDIGPNHLYIPASSLKTQVYLEKIAAWTKENKMLLNERKSNYMIISRSHSSIATRLKLNGENLECINHIKLLGIWITDKLDWDLNTKQICKKAYPRLTMLTKLKYAGVDATDLISIYISFIRCVLEYCCVLWHSSLTQHQSNYIERVQKIALKIILGDEYHEYDQALEICGLESMFTRRQKLCVKFGRKCLQSERHRHLFPEAEPVDVHLRRREPYHVNLALTERYRNSSIPYIQRLLNDEEG